MSDRAMVSMKLASKLSDLPCQHLSSVMQVVGRRHGPASPV